MTFQPWGACPKQGGGSNSKVAALQPVVAGGDFTAPLAAWAIDANTSPFPNRLGVAALDLTRNGVSMPVGPDMIAGTKFYIRRSAFAFPNQAALHASLQITGDLSIVLRCFREVNSGSVETLITTGAGGGVAAIPYYVATNSTGLLQFYYESGVFPGQTPNTINSALLVSPGSWEVISIRKNATRVRFGVGTTFQDVAIVNAAIVGGAPTLQIGRNVSGSANWGGGIKDVAIWANEITDAEVLARRRIMLGL